MKRIQQGFTLIELMIVVAIVGILAAIALPAYQDYVVRSKMSEPMGAMAACKTSVAEYLSAKTSLPLDAAAAGCPTTPTQYMASLAVATGVITAKTTTLVGASGCTLTLTPSAPADNSIQTWTGSSDCLSKYVPSTFR
ncbi:MAG: pilin [Burkholderiales bacterium]|nr:pilin [Burkholderiales bacterium]